TERRESVSTLDRGGGAPIEMSAVAHFSEKVGAPAPRFARYRETAELRVAGREGHQRRRVRRNWEVTAIEVSIAELSEAVGSQAPGAAVAGQSAGLQRSHLDHPQRWPACQ